MPIACKPLPLTLEHLLKHRDAIVIMIFEHHLETIIPR